MRKFSVRKIKNSARAAKRADEASKQEETQRRFKIEPGSLCALKSYKRLYKKEFLGGLFVSQSSFFGRSDWEPPAWSGVYLGEFWEPSPHRNTTTKVTLQKFLFGDVIVYMEPETLFAIFEDPSK